MNSLRRAMQLSLVAIAVLAVSVSVTRSQEPEPSFPPDGAWFATAQMPSGAIIPFMDIYASNGTTQGRSGTVLCTLSVPPFPGPTGKVAMSQGGHGNWIRVEKNLFAFTVMRILIDADPANAVPDGAPVGTAKFWGTITVTGADTFVGSMSAQYYGPGGLPFLTVSFTTAGARIAVETDQP